MWLVARPAGRKHGAPAGAHRVPSCWLGPGSLPPSLHTSATLHKACARMVRYIMCCEMQQGQKQCAGVAISSEESSPVRPKYWSWNIWPPSDSVFHKKEIISHSKSLKVQSRFGPTLLLNIAIFAVIWNICHCIYLETVGNFWINCRLKFSYTGSNEVTRGTDTSGP